MKLIIFDIDDTLFDFQKSEKFAFAQLMKELSLELHADNIFKEYKKVSKKLWGDLEKGLIHRDTIRADRFRFSIEVFKFSAAFDYEKIGTRYLDLLSQTAFLMEGALEVCELLKKKFKIGVITNGFKSVQTPKVGGSVLAPFFDFMVISEEVGFEKPHRKIFEYALSRAPGVLASEVLMVGDNLYSDIYGGNAFGFKTCWLDLGLPSSASDVKPDYVIKELKELGNIVAEWPNI